MRKTLFTVVLLTIFLADIVSAQATSGTARTTRYWDACKPSCAWTGNAPVNSNNPHGACTACSVTGARESNANAQNRCQQNGPAFNCMGQVPWSVNSELSYGYAASNTNATCGWCYELTFTSGPVNGKRMVIMISNIGGDVAGNQFDLMIPGGGVGLFNALNFQLEQNGVRNASLGAQYGGFRQTCGNDAACVRRMCDANFSGAALADLRNGCYWYVDWFGIADNPNANFRKVDCPDPLVRGYKEGFGGGSGVVLPPPQTHTLRVVASPATGGTVTPAAAQTGVMSGSNVNISASPASGHTFSHWTSTGTGTINNANSAATSVNVRGDMTVTANFNSTIVTPPTTHTLTVNRNPATASAATITVGGSTYTAPRAVNANTAVSISATAPSGFTFSNWSAGAGATIANVNSATTTVTLTANATITANFTQTVTTPTYTLTVNRNPSSVSSTINVGGSAYTTPRTVNGNTPITISATVPSGHRFVNWTVTGSNATIASATSASTTVTLTGNATITANFEPTYTLTVNRNPTVGGNISQAAQTNISAGTVVNIAAVANAGYTFVNWTMTGTGGTIANASSAATSVTVNGNVTINANFQATGGPTPTNYTLTLNRNPTAGGTVTPASGGSHAAGTLVRISATAASGYTFSNWTVTGTGASIANANSATTDVTLNANATVTANFILIPVTPARCTLTINRSPTAGGTVTPVSGLNYAAGTPVNISATAASGYTFSGWSITGTGATIANASSATTTVTLTANATITANFQQQTGVGCPPGEVLSRTVIPAGSGNITVTPAQNCYPQNSTISVLAVPNAGFEFDRWEGDGTWAGAPADLGTSTMWWNRSLTAYFRQGNGGIITPPPPPPGERTEITKIEAEAYNESVGDFRISPPNDDGVICIGYIENNHRATYNIFAYQNGSATLQFMLATGLASSTFTVWVNGTRAGTINLTNTGSWDTYQLVTLSGDANLRAGPNTIELRFETAVNVDYFNILALPGTMNEPIMSVRPVTQTAPRKVARTGVTLKAGIKGFSVMLPANHTYTSYSLVDLRGREIRRGSISDGVTAMRFDNLNSSVMFLRLEGKNGAAPTVVRAVTF